MNLPGQPRSAPELFPVKKIPYIIGRIIPWVRIQLSRSFLQVIGHIGVGAWSGIVTLGQYVVVPIMAKAGSAQKQAKWLLSDRCSMPYALRSSTASTVVWCHAASLGESKLLISFLGLLRRKYPDQRYILTATSATGLDFLKRHQAADICAIGVLPLDTLRLMEGVVTLYNVSRVWIMETELWPSMLTICKKHKVPVGLVNARMEEKSFGRYYKFRTLFGPLVGHMDTILVQSDEYAKRFADLGAAPGALHVTGNLKGMVVVGRPRRAVWERLRTAMRLDADQFVLTCGCIHEGEGKVIRDLCETLAQRGVDVRCIIVPRYRTEVPAILAELGISPPVLTACATDRDWQTVIVDAYGVLDDLYAIADIAFVGGTFVPVGGHNVWEAARFGIPVFFGPDFSTQTESCQQLIADGMGFSCEDPAALADAIFRVTRRDARQFIDNQAKFITAMNSKNGTIETFLP